MFESIPKMWGAGFLYCWFIAEMVGETRPLQIGTLGFLVGGAGFLYCWFMAEIVGETRPYKSVPWDFSLGGRVFYIVGFSHRWLVEPAPTNRYLGISRWGGGFFILLVFHIDGW
jgi:hypothetical protein